MAEDDPLERVDAALVATRGLLAHRDLLAPGEGARLSLALARIAERRSRPGLHVAVVGEKKAGKSTFLNAVLGARLLGAAAREYTGTVTTLARGPMDWVATRVDGGTERFAEPDRAAPIEAERVGVEEAITAAEDRLVRAEGEVDGRRRELGEAEARRAAAIAGETGGEGELERARVERTSARAALDAASGEVERTRAALPWFLRPGEVGRSPARIGAGEQGGEAADEAAGADLRREPPTSSRSALGNAPGDVGLARASGTPGVGGAAAVPALRAPSRLDALLAWLLGWIWANARERARVARESEARARDIVSRAERALLQAESRLATLRSEREAADQQAALGEAAMRAAEGEVEGLRTTLTTLRERSTALAAAAREAAEARLRVFTADLASLTAMDGRGHEIARLDVTWPDAPPDLVWVDTPGVNTDVAENQRRAWAAVEEADGVVVVSDLQQATSQTTLDFVDRVRRVVPHLVLVLTKQDRALANAEADGEGAAAVEEARRLATRRFAQQVGCDPAAVLTLVVAAEPALRGQRAPFDAELARLTRFLAAERARILAERCTQAMSTALTGVDRTIAGAEAACRQRVAAAEAQRIPDPAAFAEGILTEARGLAERARSALAALAHARVEADLEALEAELVAELGFLSDRAAVQAWTRSLATRLPPRVEELRQSWAADLVREAADVASAVEEGALAALSERYRLAEAALGQRPPMRAVARTIDPAAPSLASADLGGRVTAYDSARLGATLGGAAAGALLGSLLLPGVGTVVGGFVGALSGLLVPVGSLRAGCQEELHQWFVAARGPLFEWGETFASAAALAMLDGVEARLDAELAHYAAWIDALRSQAEEALAAEQARFAGLRRTAAAIVEARRRLG